MRSRRYLLLATIAVSVVAVLLAWTQTPRLASSLLSGAAYSLGFHDVEIAVSSVSTREISIPQATFIYDLEDSIATVSVNGVVARYDFQALREGSINTLDVEQTEITLVSREGSTGRSGLAAVTGLLSTVELDIAALVPLDTATIGQIHLVSDQFLNRISGSMQLQRQQEAIALELIARSAGGPPLRLQLVSSAPGHLQFILSGEQAPKDALVLTLAGNGGRVDVEGKVDLDSAPVGTLPSEATGIIRMSGSLQLPEAGADTLGIELTAAADFIGDGSYTLSGFDATVHGGALSEEGGALILEFNTTEVKLGSFTSGSSSIEQAEITTSGSVKWNNQLYVDVLPGSTLKADELVVKEIARISNLDATLSGVLDTSGERRITIGGGTTLLMGGLMLLETRWPEGLELLVTGDLPIAFPSDDIRLVSPATIVSPGFRAEFKDYTVESGSINARLDTVEIDQGKPLVSSEIQVNTVQLGQDESLLDLRDLRQIVSYSEDTISAGGTFTDIVRKLPWVSSLTHSVASGEGMGELKTPELILTADTPLATYIQPLDIPFAVVTGSIDASLMAKWKPAEGEYDLQAGLTMNANALGGAYKNLFFSGLSTLLNTELLPEFRTLDAQHLAVANIDAGLPVTDLMVEYKLSRSAHGPLPIFDLVSLEASILGGEIGVRNARFDPNLEDNGMSVEVKGISLGEAVALHQLEDIEATGLIDGSLPLELSVDGLHIRSGLLYAREPGGRIAYSADTSALENAAPGTDIVFNALKNFNYTSLQAEPDYDSSGLLVLGLKLQGSNPDMEGGRPINLNINLEQNVIQLLQSLRFVDGLNEAIDSRVRRYYQRLNEPDPG